MHIGYNFNDKKLKEPCYPHHGLTLCQIIACSSAGGFYKGVQVPHMWDKE